MASRTNVRNPINGKLLPGQASSYVKKARKARNGARKALRSGNPARRAEAQKVYDEAPGLIRRVYLKNM